jgi:CDGSH-type Zn-finger protein
MDKPIIAQKQPYKIDLKAGEEHFFCACGKSKGQPFCDGSHKGSGIIPKRFSVEKDGTYYLCGCKQSDNIPFCDGTHKKI